MSTVIIDIDDLSVNMLPSAQRLPGFEMATGTLLSPVYRLQELLKRFIFGSFDLDYWRSTSTYAKGEIVRDRTGIFESQAEGNEDNALNTTSWLKVLDSFIGVFERARYNGRYLYLTFALNRIFDVEIQKCGLPGFLQPPYPAPYDFGLGAGTFSSIYITTDELTQFSLIMYDDTTLSDTVYDMGVGYYAFDDTAVGDASHYKYTVHVPVAVWNLLGADDLIRATVIRAQVDKYNVTGLQYTVVTY